MKRKILMLTAALFMMFAITSILVACDNKKTEYTVTYELNGADSDPLLDSVVVEGETIEEPSGLTKEGYNLGGWFTNKNFTTASKVTFPYEPKANVTLYAKWDAKSYTMKVDTNGGDPIRDFTMEHDSELTSLNATKEGYAVKEWRLNDEDGDVVTFPYKVKGAVTFFAVWQEYEPYIRFSGQLEFVYEETPTITPLTVQLDKGDDKFSGTAWFIFDFGGYDDPVTGTWELNQETGRIMLDAWHMRDLGGYNLEIGFNNVASTKVGNEHRFSVSWMGGMMEGEISWEEPNNFWGIDIDPGDPVDPEPEDIPTPAPFVYEYKDGLVFKGQKQVSSTMDVDFNVAFLDDGEFVMIAKYLLGGYNISKDIKGTYVLDQDTYSLTFTEGVGDIYSGELTSEQAQVLSELVIDTDIEEVVEVALFEGTRVMGPSQGYVKVFLYSDGTAIQESEKIELSPNMIFGGVLASTSWTFENDVYNFGDFIRFNGSNGLIGHKENMFSGMSSTKVGNVYNLPAEIGDDPFTITFELS